MKTNIIRFTLASLLALPATPFAVAQVALPEPCLRYDPAVPGANKIVNTGTLTGFDFDTRMVNPASPSTSFGGNALTDTMITADGAGPDGKGRALVFSGANGRRPVEYAGIGSGATFLGGLGEITVTLWYKLDSTLTGVPTRTTLIRATNFNWFFLNNTRMRVDVAGVNGTGNLQLTANDAASTATGKWIFAAVTWSGATNVATFYIGDESTQTTSIRSATLSASTGGTIKAAAPNDFFHLGFHNFVDDGSGSNGGGFNGKMAGMRIYTTALTAAQVEAVRESAGTPAETGYTPIVKGWADNELAASYTTAKIAALATLTTASPDDKPSEMAGAAARQWITGGKTDVTYADTAFAILKALRDQWAANGKSASWKIGFQAKFSFLEAFSILKKNNYATINSAFDAAFEADIKTIAKNSMGPGSVNDNNQGSFDALATLQALILWPDLDTGGTWTACIRKFWANWTTRHDTTENSLNYNKLFVPYVALMAQRVSQVSSLSADAATWAGDMNHAGTRAMLTRFRDQVAGSGQMPGYGDAGNGAPAPDADCWPVSFEWAAQHYDDPTFRWAALTSWNLTRNNTGGRTPLNLFILTYTAEWTHDAVTPVQPATGSALLTRASRQSATDPDKIILAPTRDAGAPFTMAEIFGHGTHSHKEQTGSIAHYEYNSSVFLYALGYNNRNSDQSSMVLINHPDAGFPWRGYPKDNTWYEGAIPVGDLPEVTDPADTEYGAGGRHTLKSLYFRWEQRHETLSALGYLNNIRLVGADGSQTVLNPTSAATGWSGSSNISVSAELPPSGATNTSASSLRFHVRDYGISDASTGYTMPDHAGILSADPVTHPYIKFWWKAQSPDPVSKPFDDQILLMRTSYAYDNQLNLGDYAWLQAFAPNTTTANVQTAGDGKSRHGSFTIDGYFTVKTKLTRRMVQLDDGTLVVMDTVLPDADADGRLCGPVWQLTTSTAPAAIGTDGATYDATGFYNSELRATGADRLLLKMEKADAGRTHGSKRPAAPLWSNANPYATYACETLKSGVPVSYVTVLRPNNGSTPAATLASRINIQRNNADSAIVRIDNGDGATTTVSLDESDAWSVTTAATVAPPAITTPPAAQSITEQQTLTLSVVATGDAPVTYQWRKSADNGVTCTNVGADSATLTIPNIQFSDAGLYDVVITNAGGQIKSAAVQITVNAIIHPPGIITQPVSQRVTIGQNAAFTVSATSAVPMTWQWKKSADNGVTFANTGGNSDTLSIPNTKAADAGWYYVLVSNTSGSVSSGTVQLYVAIPPVITTHPQSQAATVGQDVTFTVTATSPTTMTYQWRKSAGGGSAYVNTGGDAPALTLASVQSADSGSYYVTISNIDGSVDSNTASLGIASGTAVAPSADGYAANATGGGAATPIIVTTAAEFITRAQAGGAAVITVVGTLDLSGATVSIASNKTIQGIDANATIIGGLSVGSGATNVIMRGLNVTNPAGPGLTITGAANVYITHNNFYDCQSNLVHVSKGATGITFSWNEFYYTPSFAGSHGGMQIGETSVDAQPSSVTLHDNLWSDKCSFSMPFAVRSRVHMYNNYILAPGNTNATIVGDLAQLLSENNVYQNVNAPLSKTQFDHALASALIHVNDNLYVSATGAAPDAGADPVFTPNYNYILHPAEAVATRITSHAGNTAGAASPTPGAPACSISITSPAGPVRIGAAITLTAVPLDMTPSACQWRLNNAAIPGALQSTYTITQATETDGGAYTVEARLPTGESVISNPHSLTITSGTTPVPDMNPAGPKGEGGGAPAPWYLGALLLLALARTIRKP
jgi:pectate lyase